MVYKLGLSAEKGWRKLRGFRRLADVINGVKFIDRIDKGTVLISNYTKLPLTRMGYPGAQLLLFALSRSDLFPLAGASAD